MSKLKNNLKQKKDMLLMSLNLHIKNNINSLFLPYSRNLSNQKNKIYRCELKNPNVLI